MSFGLYGRRMIKSDETEVTVENVVAILNKALPYHWENRSEIQYLWYYYRGLQPILNREKQVRPEICNKIVENRANEIVSFKSGYLMGEPLQYVSRGNGDNLSDAINQLNEFVFAEEKPAKDKELADWFHICGTSFRMVLPDEGVDEDDDSPFEIYTLDPRNTFVVYNNGLGNKPLLGVKYVVDDNGIVHYSCYSDHEYFEIVESHIIKVEPHILGDIPIIEYPLNIARIGAFELVIPLLDAINLTDSNRQDGVEQFIQALMLFHNVDILSDDYEKLREEGAIKFRDIDPQLKAEVSYLTSTLNQGETQTLVDHMYQTVLTICGMPNRNGGTSTSDTGSAVIMRDGWSAAEARAIVEHFKEIGGNIVSSFKDKVGGTYTTVMAIATELAEWIGDYYTAGIEYEYDTRGNPEIDANDIVYQENEFHDGMKVNIYRHTINFDQAFSGKVTARRVSS